MGLEGVVVPELNPRDIGELYDVRASLERMMARGAAARITDEEARVMTDIVARNAAMVGFAEDAMNLGQSLHKSIGRIADNTWATRLHEQVSDQMVRYRGVTNSTQERRDAALEEHRALAEAVIAGKVDEAGELAHQHVMAARSEALALIGASLDA